ncbi:MAG: hypothetical protein U1E06_16045 [Tabrizicola sp.]|nr:hypothetical protein [Tabrizicola sp.]
MTRWLQAARQEAPPRTELTEPTKPKERLNEGGAVATVKGLLSVMSVLSEEGTLSPEPKDRTDGLEPDAGAYLDRLRIFGPATYGAMATAMGWGATRAWRAEAKLRALGLVRLGEFGRGHPYPNPNLANDFGKS